MANLRAVILAAGRGVRMGGETPKTLIPIGDHEPLLHYILTGLKEAGIDDLLVITGHRPRDVETFVNEKWAGSSAVFLRNMRYASWGNFHSVRVALDQSPGMNVLIVNSDVIVPPDVFRRTASTQGDLVLAVQTRRQLNQEDMRVMLDGDRIVGVSKNLKIRSSHGEYAGVSLLRPAAAAAYVDISTELEWQAATSLYYEDVYNAILDRIDARSAVVREGEYAEVDSPEDVPAAVAVIERHSDAWTADAPSS
ncbi:MAG: NTP transferase domain-containing protein [Actinomycetota bacterium]|nr:NTP transferase domain-containing protein [Actinomycetota bacterium]